MGEGVQASIETRNEVSQGSHGSVSGGPDQTPAPELPLPIVDSSSRNTTSSGWTGVLRKMGDPETSDTVESTQHRTAFSTSAADSGAPFTTTETKSPQQLRHPVPAPSFTGSQACFCFQLFCLCMFSSTNHFNSFCFGFAVLSFKSLNKQ